MLGDLLRKNKRKVKTEVATGTVELTEEEKLLNEQAKLGNTELSYSGYEDDKFNAALDGIRCGKIPKLNHQEREILEFCDARDMHQFLKEEFDKHPIILNDSGELVGNSPFKHYHGNHTFLGEAIAPPVRQEFPTQSEDDVKGDLGII